MRGKFGAFFERTDADGRTYIEYVGSKGHKPCSLDASKQCTFCGKCFKESLPPDAPKNATEAAERYIK